MISQVDEALRTLVRSEALDGSDVEVVLRRADQGLGGPPQRADGQPLPLRHPRGPAPPRARAGSTSAATAGTSSRGGRRRGTSSSPTWSPRGRSAPRTSTGCCPRCCTASCATTRCPPSCSSGRWPRPALPVPLTVALPPPEDRALRGRLVRARRRAEAVARPRGRSRRSTPASAFPAGPPVRGGHRVDLSDVADGAATAAQQRSVAAGPRPSARRPRRGARAAAAAAGGRATADGDR